MERDTATMAGQQLRPTITTMTPTAHGPRRSASSPPDADHDPELARLGLARGEQVRFRRSDTQRWSHAHLVGLERDGSLSLRDAKGAARAIPLELVEVATLGPRGARTWEPVTDRAARTEQLRLL